MTLGSNERPIDILLVEDNPGDARLTQETLKGSTHQLNITVAEDGDLAMARLRREGEHADSSRPDLILLDLKLPGMSGEEVLEEINADANLSPIPVVILTSTEAERSLLDSYGIPPSRYWRKPINVGLFDNTVSRLQRLSGQPISMSLTRQPAKAATGRKWWWPFG